MEQYRLSGDGTTHERDLCTSTAPQVGDHGDQDVHEYTVTTNKDIVDFKYLHTLSMDNLQSVQTTTVCTDHHT